ncbi:MAG: sensor histidine kinase [Chloroflexi bacterium]|nr:sensor histidine kinase [Chloroflexota bacterium]
MARQELNAVGERELLAGFRLRTAAVARNAAWITMAGIAALTAPHHSPADAGEHWIVWGLLGGAALANLVTYAPAISRMIQESLRAWPFYAWTLLLLLFDTAIVFSANDAQHQVYLIYIPVVLFAVATLEMRAAAAVVLLAIGSALGAIAISEGMSADVAIGSTGSFVVVALLGAYFSSEQRQEIAKSAFQRAKAVQRGEELAVLHERATALNDELQATVGKVIRAQEEERRRIGRELHDEAVQLLSVASVRVGGLEEEVPEEQANLREGLADVRAILVDALWEVRKIIVALRPSDLDDLGLIPAVSAYARNRLTEAGVAVEAHMERPERRLTSDAETAVFRIAQEAVNNIARHAQAQHAVIAFAQRNGNVVLTVQDDGIGFDASHVHTNGNGEGLGLMGMKERAALLGGRFEVASQPGGGTSIRVSIPLPAGE